ncbi:stealth family protein [Actinoplanes sp. NPDC051851]|uniref:stealth family protein n=1 Tax=Actinoplanes sp. NPDC051851 TaxID=3154753 RepID=UPI003416A09E
MRKDDGPTLRRILRLAPWPVRRRIFRAAQARLLPRIAPERRLRVARALMPLPAPRRHRPAAPGATIRVRTAAGRVPARVVASSAPSRVRRENLDRVTGTLDGGGVAWFRVPATDPLRTALAVRETDRRTALRLLKRTARRDHGRILTVGAGVVAVCWPVSDPGGTLVLGAEHACEVEFWREHGDRLIAPRRNPVADSIPAGEPEVDAPEPVFGDFSDPADTTAYRTRRIFTAVGPDRIGFPVDAVVTWVDGGDPAWQRRKARALAGNEWVTEVNRQAANDSRYASRDELRYALRAVHCFAPWIRHVFLVTDDQVPAWLDLGHPGLTLVGHREIFGTTGTLPTFNSQAIESRLHRIPGLAEHFLYLNDDMILGRPVTPDLFFTPGGLTKFFPSKNQVDLDDRGPRDRPADSAAKNNRRLIREMFGRVLTRKMMHTPYPSRRSVLEQIERHFHEQVRTTAEHQFRHPDDVSLLSSLQQYYAYLTGQAVTGTISYQYTDLADAATPVRLATLLRHRHMDAFCLNDVDTRGEAVAVQDALLAEFLPAYLPFPSPYELAQPRAGTTAVPRPAPRLAA